MRHARNPGASSLIWQGYQHDWEYNHRLNRFGSYVRKASESDSGEVAIVGHTAASGTGDDTAHFTELVTRITGAKGVAFQTGWVETIAECQRGDLTPFFMRIEDLDLQPELRDRDIYTVVLNGFDICALEHAEKIMTLDLEVSDPTIYAGGTKARFRVFGEVKFDCRSPECQLLPWRLEVEGIDGQEDEAVQPSTAESLPSTPPKKGLSRRKVDRVARWIKRQLTALTDVEEIKRSMVGDEGDILRRRLFRLFGREFFIKFLKWRFSAPYLIRVHYLIIAGDRHALAVTESPNFENVYGWGLEEEIHLSERGILPITIRGEDPHDYAVNTLAFRRLCLDVMIDEDKGSEDPIQWGKGMHLLGWTTAIREIEPTEEGISANLHLFYKNWSEAMNEVITLTTWGAVRAAGRANIGARLTLLQIQEAAESSQLALPGRIYWPGAGRSASRDPRARFERLVDLHSSVEGSCDATDT